MDHDPGCKGWASATGGKLCESEEDKARCLVIPPPYPSYHPLASCAKVVITLTPPTHHPPGAHAAHALPYPSCLPVTQLPPHTHTQAFMLRVCPASCGICTNLDKDEL